MLTVYGIGKVTGENYQTMKFKQGDIVKFIEFPGSKWEGPSKLNHIHNEIGFLIRKASESIAMDWGACWVVLVNDTHTTCYERWMEVIRESR